MLNTIIRGVLYIKTNLSTSCSALFSSKLADSRLDVTAELFRTLHDLYLFCFLRGVGKVFLHAHLRGIDGTLHTAQANPYLLVKPVRVVVLIDGENLALLLFGQAKHRLYAVELGHVLALVKQYLAVGVVDDALLDDGRLDDVVHLLRHDNGLAEILSDSLVEILDIVRHICRGNRLPRFLDKYHFSDTLQSAHLVDEGFHDDNRHHGEEVFVVLHLVYLENDKAFGEQVNVLVRVQQEVVATAMVVLLQCRQEVVDVEVRERYLDVPLLHILPIDVPQILIEGVEAGNDGMIRPDKFYISIDGRTKFACFCLGDMLIGTLLEREQ